MDEPSRTSPESKEYVVPRAHRLVRGLTWFFAGVVAPLWVWVFIGLLPVGVAPAMAREWIDGGLGSVVMATLLVALTASVATLVLTGTRIQYAASENQHAEMPPAPDAGAKPGFSPAALPAMAAVFATPGGPAAWDRRIAAFFGEDASATLFYRWIKDKPGLASRQGQAIIATTGLLFVYLSERLFWPTQPFQGGELNAGVAVVVLGATFGLAFLSFVAERFVRAFPEPQLPEAPAVRRLLSFTMLMLAAAGFLEVFHSFGATWVYWPMWVLAHIPVLVMLEFTCRALGRLFLPTPAPAAATAVTDSLLVSLITGGPRAPGMLLRTQLGLDFSRSWAIAFLAKALLPAIFATGLLCWGLTGVKLIDIGQRGIYERFGAPVSVLGPGLHMILPWPFGRLRSVEYGTIHSVAIGVDQAEPDESISVAAEAPPPLALDRLWETSHPGQAYYLVPSTGTGPQGFQEIATEINVLYRVGLTDSAALQSVYQVADPQSLIRDEAGRLVLGFFNSRTLETVIGARRENVAGMLRDELAADIDSHHAGIDIVSVLIEEIHPPVGAAAAYHAVQAAEINATARIFDEQARAELTTGTAQQQAYQMTTAADARAAEIQRTANAAAYRFDADRRAYGVGGKAFLLERFYGNLDAALSKGPVTIIDYRLNSTEGPILDLRPPAASSSGASAPAASAPLIPAIEGGQSSGISAPAVSAPLMPENEGGY